MSSVLGFTLHPGLVLIGGACVLPWLRGWVRIAAVLAIPLVALLLLWQLPAGPAWTSQWLGYAIEPLVIDRLSRLFATMFLLMALGGGLYSLGQASRTEVPAAFVYAGSAVGVALAGDLVTVFVFWELMAVGSTVVIWSAGTRTAYAASMRYAMIHLLGGVILFAGIAGHLAGTGSAQFGSMNLETPATWLILVGFLINAGAPPLSAWLPDAYPEASWSGTVFLSAFTTKAAVYVLLRGFPGTELLVWVGLFMAFYGLIYALLENDMRRLLAYSIVNQVGFMLVGIGIGTELSLNGSAAHAAVSVFYTALMLMSAGAVLRATGQRNCTELGGLFRSMPLTALCGSLGALAIASFPLTAGFVSKSMIPQAAAEGHMLWAWLLLVAVSAGVFVAFGIKFPWLVFFGRDAGLRPTDPPASMRWAMCLFALLCIAPGVWPAPLYAMLPYPVDYEPYTAAHVLTQVQLLLFAGLAWRLLADFLKGSPGITLDVDWVWRCLLPALFQGIAALISAAQARVGSAIGAHARRISDGLARQRNAGGMFVRSWPTGSMALWVMLMLLGYLIFYYAG